ncbi:MULTISPECIES: hypothetical protein [Pseudomonas]|uniref:hypothetical protein n=1 Tax=Pseudomonas TaxID=286 RepID=UPI001BE85DAB|nr:MULTISPECIES: hypothetical protein [Pseudomonas]MBT2338693.1 hypothetical protein [Pseudomonas fluorescens]MCD4530567.1 hypothetical protein [Pseudomonas sp. C3-2018]
MNHAIMGVVDGEDFASYEIKLPIESKDLAKIMNWVQEEDYLYDYRLDKAQIEALEEACSIELPRNLVLFLTSGGA